MADNIPITPGAGATIATDDVAGVHYQVVKQAFGLADAATLVSASNPLPVTGTVTVGNASLAVTGAFYQATQPVSLTSTTITGSVAVTGPLTDTQLRATAVPVSGTFFQATQPVSIATMPSTPVTGTFWQATQPVSGTVTANAGTGTFTVGGTVALGAGAAAIGTVGVTSLPALVAGTAVIGALVANQSVNNAQIGGVAVAVGSGVTGTGVQRVTLATDVPLPAGTNSIGTTMGPTLTKATQGTTGYSTQDLKDAGRVVFSAATVIAGVTAVTAEAMLSMVPVRDGVAAAAATSFTVTAGKRLRLSLVNGGLTNTAAAAISARVVVRYSSTGAVTTASPILTTLNLHAAAAVAQTGDHEDIILPDGVEFSGTMQIGLSHVGSVATGTVRASLIGFEY